MHNKSLNSEISLNLNLNLNATRASDPVLHMHKDQAILLSSAVGLQPAELIV